MPNSLKSVVIAVSVCLLLVAVSPFSRAQQDAANFYRMAIPGKNWSLNIPKSAFTEGSQRNDGDVTTFGGGREGNKKLKLSPVLIDIRMEPAKAPGDAQVVSDFAKKTLLKKSAVDPQSLKQLVYNKIPVIRYSVDISHLFPSPNTMPRGKVFNAYYVKDDVWITVQLNFLEFKKEDEQYFHSLLDALKIENITK
jgi:hypothetical protein